MARTLLVLLAAWQSQAVPFSNFYSESIYVNHIYWSQVRIRLEQPLYGASPYLQMGSEITASSKRYSSSEVYGAAGVKLPLGGYYSLFSEFRGRQDLWPNKLSSDIRLLGVFNTFWEFPIPFHSRFFFEPYQESLLSSYDKWNFIASGYIRSGFRYPISTEYALDLFLEPFWSSDTSGHNYNRRSDLKMSVRAVGQWGFLIATLTGSIVRNISGPPTFLSSEISRPQVSYRALLTLGGQW